MLGNTLLHTACLEGNLENVDLALEVVGNDIDAKNIQFLTPLHIACKYGRTDIALKLIEFGADINGKPENNCRLTDTPLQLAILKKDLDLVKLLIEKGADVNAKNHNNFTALHISCFFGLEDITKILIDQGADINVKHENGQIVESPLHLAYLQKHDNLVRLLEDRNADKEAMDKEGRRPSEYAKQESLTQHNSSEDGSDPNIRNKYQPKPLHRAAQDNSLDMLKLLLKKDIDIEDKDQFGATALFYAIRNNHHEAVHLLLEKGANVETYEDYTKIFGEIHFNVDRDLKNLLKKTLEADLYLNNAITLGHHENFKLALDILKSFNLKNRIDHFKKGDFLFLMIDGNGDASKKINTLNLLSREGFDIYKTNSKGDNILSLALKRGDKKLIEEIFKEENGLDFARLSKDAMSKILLINQESTSCFSCLSAGNILKITFAESRSPSLVEIKLSKEVSNNLKIAFEQKHTIKGEIGFVR
jgi:ankyrin repeat protein